MSRPTPLSGFPELLPAQRYVEQQVLARLAETFELHGFANVETRAVEPLDQLLGKGETSKEVYVLRRLQAEEGDAGHSGLHFDLTVPFARYVLENAGKLEFPFRRYQIQKVWRGERPQEGRFREFTQADIDVIGRDTLAFHHDVEVARVMLDALRGSPTLDLACRASRLQVNNRKLIQGFYAGLGVEDADAVMRAVDKLDKLTEEQVHAQLVEDAGLTARAGRQLPGAGPDQHQRHLLRRAGARARRTARAAGRGPRPSSPPWSRAARRWSPTASRSSPTSRSPAGSTTTPAPSSRPGLTGYESLGSICSGGRYDALATDGRTTYPGVGISLGVSRVLVPLLGQGVVDRRPLRPERRPRRRRRRGAPARERRARRAAARQRRALRGRARRPKFGKQIRHAERRGIPYVLFPGERRRARRDQGHPQRRPGRRSTSPPGRLPSRTCARASPPRTRGAAPVIRTHDAGSLRSTDVGSEVTLAGWVARRRDHGGVAFIDLREASGVVQVVIRDEAVVPGATRPSSSAPSLTSPAYPADHPGPGQPRTAPSAMRATDPSPRPMIRPVRLEATSPAWHCRANAGSAN